MSRCSIYKMLNHRYKDTEIKGKISQQLESAILESGKLAQAVTKSSRTRETLNQSTKTFVGLETSLSKTNQCLEMMLKTVANLESRSSELENSLKDVEDLRIKIDHILEHCEMKDVDGKET